MVNLNRGRGGGGGGREREREREREMKEIKGLDELLTVGRVSEEGRAT